MGGTVASLEFGWGGLLGPIPRHTTGKQWPGNHRGEPRHRISGRRVVATAVIVALVVRLPGILRLGLTVFLWWQGRCNPEE